MKNAKIIKQCLCLDILPSSFIVSSRHTGTSNLFWLILLFSITAEPRFDIHPPRYYGQLSLSLEKALEFSLNSTCLIRTLVNANHGLSFLAQSTESHRKSSSLMQTPINCLLSVIDLSIFKVGKKPSAKSTSNISEPYSSPREGWIVDANFRLFWHQSGYAESDF